MDFKSFLQMANFEEDHWWFYGRRNIIKYFLDKFKLNMKAKILEIGCGTGSNLELLSKYGKVFALEPSKDAFIYLNKKNFINIDLRKGTCPADLKYKEKFDLICLFDVLEHIEEDQHSINKIVDILKPHGRLFITVPSYQWLWSSHDVNLMHKRRYNKKTLRNLFKNLSIKEEDFTYFNSFLFPFALVQRLFLLNLKNDTVNNRSPNYAVNFILKKIFLLESFFLRFFSLPFGLSLLIILTKD